MLWTDGNKIMEQWKIISEIYKQIATRTGAIVYPDVKITVNINDICQCMIDKSGQRIIVDEKQYEQPAVYEMSVEILFEGNNIDMLLQAYGEAAVLFKDNPELDIVKYNWHGSSTDKIYLEPVIRHVDHGNVNYCEGVYRYSLIYKTEFSLNSQKAYGFKRVEKRDIYGVVKK